MTGFWTRSAFARAIGVTALAVLALGAMACGDDDDDDDAATAPPAGGSPTSAATAAAQGGVTITIGDNQFQPSSQTIQKGTKVTWNWAGSNPHSVEGKFKGADVKSERQSSGKFEFTFAEAGTFDYQCGVHGAAMPGKITVQ